MAGRADRAAAEPVTVTIARQVAPGREEDFARWNDELTEEASAFPGFLGAGMLRPSRVGEPWHVIFRFDSDAHLHAWETSPEREALMQDGEDLVHATQTHRVSGLETWFSLPGKTAPAPPKWKMFLVSAAAIYLLNVLLSVAVGWLVATWLLPVRLLVISLPVTALMTWLVMPRAARLLQNWLYAPPRRP
jgi:uncharacterized protein